MKNLLSILIICCSMSLYAQKESNYSVIKTEEGAFLIKGTQYPINLSKNNCMEFYESTEIIEGEHFIIIDLYDEMENSRGSVIFDKKGNQINFDIVQEQRKLQYKHAQCCIYVKELNGKLYFYDLIDSEGEDCNCYYDSQTYDPGITIPRYYIFEPKKNKVEVFILEPGCKNLIENGKVICK